MALCRYVLTLIPWVTSIVTHLQSAIIYFLILYGYFVPTSRSDGYDVNQYEFSTVMVISAVFVANCFNGLQTNVWTGWVFFAVALGNVLILLYTVSQASEANCDGITQPLRRPSTTASLLGGSTLLCTEITTSCGPLRISGSASSSHSSWRSHPDMCTSHTTSSSTPMTLKSCGGRRRSIPIGISRGKRTWVVSSVVSDPPRDRVCLP